MKIIRNIFFILTLLPVWAVASESQGVVDVEPVHSNSPEFSNPEWEYGGFQISVGFDCDSVESFLWRPEVSCDDPYLQVSGSITVYGEAFVRVGDVRLDAEDLWGRTGSTSMGVKIYKEIVASHDPVIYFEAVGRDVYSQYGSNREGAYGRNIRLIDFESRVAEYMSAREKRQHAILEDDVRYWFLSVVAWAFGVPLAIFIFWWLIRRIAPVAAGIKDGCPGVIRRVRSGVFDFKIRQAVVDEAVRQVTRQKISEVDDKDKESLVRRMQEALDRDDISAAKEISLILTENSRDKDV